MHFDNKWERLHELWTKNAANPCTPASQKQRSEANAKSPLASQKKNLSRLVVDMSRVIPFRSAGQLRNHDSDMTQKVGKALGATLAVYGLTRRSLFGLLIAGTGGGLAYYAHRASASPQEQVARSSVLLNCSPEEAFRFWRDFENLPRFMAHLQSVTVADEKHSQWIFRGPLGRPVTINSLIDNERKNESIVWNSLPGSDLMMKGSVEFRPAPNGRGTVLEANIRYSPPAGSAGGILAKVLGKDPSFLMRQDLRRLKALIEAGEIPTVEGQPHGPRTLLTGIVRVMNPDQRMRHDVSLAEMIDKQRRAS